MSIALYILVAILVFGVLIAVHELGHFLAARACGVQVLEFAIGMGPAIAQKTTKRGTKVSWRCLPFGGYCAMEGEDSDSGDPRAFTNSAPWKRLVILVAGAAMNFLLGFLLIVVFFSQLPSFTTPTITNFMDNCPYESTSGLQQGDVFWKIDGHRIYTSSDVSLYLARNTSDYKDIVVLRDGQKVALNRFYMVQRDYVDEETGETVQKYGFYFGVKESGFGAQMKYSWYCSLDFVREVWMGLSDLFTGAVSIKQMTGPVGIVDIIAQVGNQSPSVFDALLNIAYLTAFIAINLAVVNLLPLPALDGGRVFFLLVTWVVERVIRQKVNPKYEGYINTAGLLLLMALMVYVMYNDIARIITKS
jgi:Predicted membrane-associated Zn-dependent proteases 1